MNLENRNGNLKSDIIPKYKEMTFQFKLLERHLKKIFF